MSDQERLCDVCCAGIDALSGHVTKNMWAVSVSVHGDHCRFNFYLEGKPDEDDEEHMTLIATEFLAALPWPKGGDWRFFVGEPYVRHAHDTTLFLRADAPLGRRAD